MKKSCVLLLTIAIACISMAGIAQAMDADELIKKNIEAMGGRKAIEAVKTAKASGKFLTQGMEFPFSMISERPNYLRIEAEVMGMTMIQAFDGEAGWTINPMTGSTDAQRMGPFENKGFKMQADQDGGLMNYKERGYTVEFLGEEDVEGTPCYKLSMDTHEDITMVFFFDKEYFLIIKQSVTMMMDEQKVESQTYMSDFQEVGDLIAPFAIETRMGDVVANQIVMEAIEQNIEVDSSIFVMPEAAPAAPADPALENK